MTHTSLTKQCREYFPTPEQSGDFGIELEIEGTDLPMSISGWRAKNEPSLRDATRGGPGMCLEYVTNGAMKLETLSQRLSQLHSVLTTSPTNVVLTPRASTHIHINAQRWTLREYFGFVFLFSVVEPLLLRLCGPSRNGNLFCLPISETGDLPRIVSMQAQYLLRPAFDWPTRGRYASLNLDSLLTFGSLEVRCFPNSITPSDILSWCGWLQNIRTEIQSTSEPTFSGLLNNAIENPNELVSKIFGEVPLDPAALQATPQELIHLGAETGYEILRAMRPLFVPKEQAEALLTETLIHTSNRPPDDTEYLFVDEERADEENEVNEVNEEEVARDEPTTELRTDNPVHHRFLHPTPAAVVESYVNWTTSRLAQPVPRRPRLLPED